MKAWDEAKLPGHCAYDNTHVWKKGDRIFMVRGTGWEKLYCANCAKQHHGAPEDTGELLTLEDSPRYPEHLKPQAFPIAERFDAKAAAAGKDSD